MRELHNVEIRNVSGAIHEPEPWATTVGSYRNPHYVYWNTTDSLQDPTSIVIERA